MKMKPPITITQQEFHKVTVTRKLIINDDILRNMDEESKKLLSEERWEELLDSYDIEGRMQTLSTEEEWTSRNKGAIPITTTITDSNGEELYSDD
ncbi:MAG TPA: hypothetical protein QF753_02100 [Victivallales bacterium]|nr:hypothetical protein [Victivallales bacterium]